MFCVKISCLFWGGWQLRATLRRQLTNMEPVCTTIFLPWRKHPFQVWCYKPFPGLANIEPIYGPKALNRFCSYTPGRKSHQKNTETADQVLIEILLKTMSKSYIFWPHKGGTPQEHVLCVKISCLFWGRVAASGYIEVATY